MESAVSFAPRISSILRGGAGQGGARPTFCGVGRGGAACFSAGRGVHPWIALLFLLAFLSITCELLQLSRLTNDNCIKDENKEEETMPVISQSAILNESLM